MRLFAAMIVLAFAMGTRAAEPGPAAVEFFEKKVRPLLIDNCYSCHGEKKAQLGLRLDSRAGILKGGENGPVVAPGNPEKSKLIHAIRHDSPLKMPEKKLPPEAIAVLTEWVKLGVPFPESATAKSSSIADRRSHWAYQPVKPVQPPECKSADSSVTPLDRFILAKLEEKGATFSPLVNPRTLIRRAYYDLIGLPPTAEAIAEFETALTATPQAAWGELIDRLLASPQYGETQARHWLDLARYADTKGYVFTEDRNFPYAYTYRDWAIRAFNADMPYNRFIELQIAADKMNSPDKRDLAAMGFLTLGRRFLNNPHDIIDDRLDVTFRTFLGMTIACARCHDHKFDPIPTKDYYSLYGVFASSVEPKDLPLIGEEDRAPAALAFEKELKKREEEVLAMTRKLLAAHIERLRKVESIAAYLVAVRDIQGKPNERIQTVVRERDLNPRVLGRWREFLREKTNDRSPIFAPLAVLSALPDDAFDAKAPEALAKLLSAKDAKKPINPLIVKAFEGKKPATFKEVAAIYATVIASNEVEMLGATGPLNIPFVDAEKIFNRADLNKVSALRKKVDAFKATSPAAPPRAMVLKDSPAPYSPVVFIRGNPGNRGPAVPRQFPEILSSSPRKSFGDGGRLEMAKAIADPKNPLTARVMVNRLWANHFGQGLVRTPSDFGLRSDPPTHPELLDFLALTFRENNWSVKKMHKLIMLSRAYRQLSDVSPEMAKLDPENRFLNRMNRRRLDFEATRDSMLLASGRLDRTMFGKSVDIFKEPFSNRRTMYAFIDRQNLPGTLRIFDFAGPDQHSPQRFNTTVPQQALFLLNSPFVIEQARALVARKDMSPADKPEQRIADLYRLVHGRAPTREETALGLAFLDRAEEKAPSNVGPRTATTKALDRWEQLAQVLLVSNEVAFVD